ncbi:MAG: hypothetical protein H6719_17895 [Sandaracinaceae bacterium]|nr:hypothetical protein [Sandaracinaceae bacterium]
MTFNITVTPTGDLTEAYFVVRNDDPLLSLCSVSGEVAMIDASGGSLGSFFVSYDSQVMEAFGIALTCIAPGGIALGYGNASGSALLDRVAELHYVFNGDGYDTTVPYADVRNEGLAVIDPYGGGMYWALSGTLRVVTGSIRSPDVTVFPIVGGLPIDDLGHIELATFGAGDRLPYTTTAAETMFSEYFVTVDYRAPSPVVADTPELRRAILDRDRRDAIREANRARVRTHF